MSNYVEAAYIISRALLWVCAGLGIIFPIMYHYSSRGTWSFTPIGRHIMQTRAVFALLLLFTALALYIPVEITVTAAVVLYIITISIFINQIRFIVSPKAMDPLDVLDDPLPTNRISRLLIREDPLMKSRPVVIAMSILAGLQFLFGGIAAINTPLINENYSQVALAVGAIGTLIVASAQTGIQFYVQSLVTPHVDVAAFRDDHGQIIAGPAAPPEGERVDVVDESTGDLH